MNKQWYIDFLAKNSKVEDWRSAKENILILLNQKPRYKLEVIKLIYGDKLYYNKNAIHRHFKDLVEMNLIEKCYPEVTEDDGRAKTRQYYKIKKQLKKSR